MATIVRPGVNGKWLKDWKKIRRNLTEWVLAQDQDNRDFLAAYAREGVLNLERPDNPPVVNPPFEKWEFDVCIKLSRYGLMRLFEMEVNSLDSGRFDSVKACHAFAARFTTELINLRGDYLFPLRLNGRYTHSILAKHVLFTALGVVIGCREEAYLLARLQLAMLRRGYYGGDTYSPIYLFVLRILADFLGEPPVPLAGSPLADPIFAALFDEWRNPDPQVLVPICLAACDFHTHRCYQDPQTRTPQEFDNGDWTRTPIEILLLFKLRQLLGLENPSLDHPLMNTPLGVLPPEVPFEPDDLVKGLRERMKQEGYDEAAIATMILTDTPPKMPVATPVAEAAGTAGKEFLGIRLRPFVSPGFGFIFHAPEAWQDGSDQKYFQVIDPATNTQFTGGGYENPGISLEEWAHARLEAVNQGMPFLKQVKAPYPLQGNSWSGIAAEYRGTFPQRDHESHYLIVCLHTEKRLLSFTVTATVKAFAENEALYRGLLEGHLLLGR